MNKSLDRDELPRGLYSDQAPETDARLPNHSERSSLSLYLFVNLEHRDAGEWKSFASRFTVALAAQDNVLYARYRLAERQRR